MSYFVLRNGQQYGPYSQADVQRYLHSGDIFPGDLSRTEEMNEWLPVSRVLSSPAPPSPLPVAAPKFAGGILPPHPFALAPLPPRMHWGVLLLLMILTFGFFGWIWSFVIAQWVRKIDARNHATPLLIFAIAANIGALVLLYLSHDLTLSVVIVLLLALALFFFAIFDIRQSIRGHYCSRDNTFSLSALLTFFCHIVYFQFKFNRMRDANNPPTLVPAHP